MYLKKFCILWLTLITLWFGSGCTTINAPAPTPTPTPTLTAEEIIARSTTKMLTVKTLHFAIVLTGALDYIDRPPTTALKQVEGDLVRPDQVRALVKVSSFGLVTEIGLITQGETSYVTNPLNQRWQVLPPEWGWYFDPRLPFDDEVGIPSVIPHIDLEKTGVEEIEGRTYYRLEGIAEAEQITWWTAGLIAFGEVPIQIWIDTETFLLHRVHLIELSSDPENPTEWDIAFSNYDYPFEIEAPPLTPQP